MKKLLTLMLIVSLAQWCNAQQIINARKVTTSESLKPPIDTIIAPTYLNEVRLRTQDSAWYVFMQLTGKKWYKFTTSPGDPLFFNNGPGTTYFISNTGNDANHGMSPDAPWQTIAKVNAVNFNPGDKILFKGGETFTGTVTLTTEDAGAPSFPVVVSSYGKGRAIISSGAGSAIEIFNTEQIEVRKLEMFGNNTKSLLQVNHGVHAWQDQNTLPLLTHYVVDDCVIRSYSRGGVFFTTWTYPGGIGGTTTTSGFDSVFVTSNDISDCGHVGIYGESAWPAITSKYFYVARNNTHHNPGNPGYTTASGIPTGHGILLTGNDGGIIEYNESHHNGENSQGNIGIFVSDCRNIIMQYNESHHNVTIGATDGGGLDIDGGASHCIMQYNYSHDNHGAGYLVYGYSGTTAPMDSNIVRYNVSVNDALHYGGSGTYGGITIGCADAGYTTNTFIYNNTIIIDTTGNGVVTPRAGITGINSGNMNGVFFHNNIFYTNGVSTAGITWPASTTGSNNIYFSPNAAEMNLALYGTQVNPEFANTTYSPSGIGVTSIKPIYKNPFKDLIGYVPLPGAPGINAALAMPTNNLKHDMLDNYIITPDVGAFESIAMGVSLTGSAILNFPSMPSHTHAVLTLPLPGAIEGDPVYLGTPNVAAISGVMYYARVSAPNMITIFAFNAANATRNPPPGLFKVRTKN